VRGKLRQTPQP